MTVAANLIKQIGHQVVADACEVGVVQTYKWTYPESRGGTAGRIPAKHLQTIMDLAKARGIEVDLMDLIRAHEKKAS